jgi:hypothetical protein
MQRPSHPRIGNLLRHLTAPGRQQAARALFRADALYFDAAAQSRKAAVLRAEANRGTFAAAALIRGASINGCHGTVNFHHAFPAMSKAKVVQLLRQNME